MQSRHAMDVARTLGATGTGAFFRVASPLARPAIVAGLTLVMMECINDIGAVEFFGVNTLTASEITSAGNIGDSQWLSLGASSGNGGVTSSTVALP